VMKIDSFTIGMY